MGDACASPIYFVISLRMPIFSLHSKMEVDGEILPDGLAAKLCV
jgi:hypothetical protein